LKRRGQSVQFRAGTFILYQSYHPNLIFETDIDFIKLDKIL